MTCRSLTLIPYFLEHVYLEILADDCCLNNHLFSFIIQTLEPSLDYLLQRGGDILLGYPLLYLPAIILIEDNAVLDQRLQGLS